LGYRLRKSVLLTYSKISEGVLLYTSRVSILFRHTTAGRIQYPVANPIGTITNLIVAHHVQQRDDVGTARQILQDLDLALYLLLLDRLQDFDDAFLVVDDVDALKDLRVFSPADLANNLVVFEHAPGDVDRVVIPIGAGHVRIDIGVHTGDAGSAGGVVQRHVGSGRRRAKGTLARKTVGERSIWVEWWGEEAEVSGTMQVEEGKASNHGERYRVIPG
jgi:hypothetical protein